jgi:hypothetical protein
MPRDRRTGGQSSISGVELYEGGYTPWERAGQVALSRTPEAFNYGSLEEKYPTRQVMPMVPSYIQNKLDEENLARKTNEVALRVREAQLSNYDSELNAKRAIAEQTIAARPMLSQLNPQDPDFLDKLDKVFIDFPQIEQNQQLMSGQVARLVNTHNRYISKIKPQTSGDPYKDYEDAYKAVTALRTAKPDKKTEYTKEDEIFESLQVQKMDQAMARMSGAMQPSTQQQPALAPTGEDADIITARKLISRKPELKEEINRRLISAGKPPIE